MGHAEQLRFFEILLLPCDNNLITVVVVEKERILYYKINIKMKRTYVITGFSRYPYAALVEKSRQIVSSLNGNTSFGELSALLDTVKITIDHFENTLQQSNDDAILQQQQYRFALILLLNDLATYVQNNSGNDVAVMRSSGYNYIVNEA